MGRYRRRVEPSDSSPLRQGATVTGEARSHKGRFFVRKLKAPREVF